MWIRIRIHLAPWIWIQGYKIKGKIEFTTKETQKNSWLNSVFPLILYPWIRIRIRNADPDPRS